MFKLGPEDEDNKVICGTFYVGIWVQLLGFRSDLLRAVDHGEVNLSIPRYLHEVGSVLPASISYED
jgi:hypothetical protein